MNTLKKTVLQSLTFLTLFVPMSAFSASIIFESNKQTLGVGQEFSLQIFLDTEKESVNAVEGKIVFPANLLEITEIQDGNSSINFWIEKPQIVSPGALNFSGIIPGGVTGSKSSLFTLVFRSKIVGEGNIVAQNIHVLKNDGVGTEVGVKYLPFHISIVKSITENNAPNLIAETTDLELPERFNPEIAQSDEMFDGKYFLVFATQDKGSGIGHYEVREGFFGTFVTTTSPYVLQNQKVNQKISVKAIDKKGNERIEVLYPANMKQDIRNLIIFVLLAIVVLYIGILLKKRYEKNL